MVLDDHHVIACPSHAARTVVVLELDNWVGSTIVLGNDGWASEPPRELGGADDATKRLRP
jgi:hypothetical protein